jgi:hypothetical protein
MPKFLYLKLLEKNWLLIMLLSIGHLMYRYVLELDFVKYYKGRSFKRAL